MQVTGQVTGHVCEASNVVRITDDDGHGLQDEPALTASVWLPDGKAKAR